MTSVLVSTGKVAPVLVCPSGAAFEPQTDKIYFQRGSYMLLGRNVRTSDAEVSPVYAKNYRPMIASRMKKISKTVMLRECLGIWCWLPRSVFQPNSSNLALLAPDERKEYYEGRHAMRSNLEFYDGHAETRDIRDIAVCADTPVKSQQYGMYFSIQE